VVVIKTIVNATKIKSNAIVYVDVEIAKIVKMEKIQKIKMNQNMSVVWPIVFLLSIIK
jgi:predicted glycosyltransferase involved in capsule biosynthesis